MPCDYPRRKRKRKGKTKKRVVLLAVLLQGSAFAADGDTRTRVGLGAGLLSDSFSDGMTLTIAEQFGKDYRWELGLMYVDDQKVCPSWEVRNGHPCPVSVDRNWSVYGQRIWTWIDQTGDFRVHFGLGVAHWARTNRALGSRTTIPITVAVDLPWPARDQLGLRLGHFSNAGSHTPNLGQDFIELTWTFGGTKQ